MVDVYGLDIETDTTVDGFDPAVASIVAVALATERGSQVFTGDEAQLLEALDAALASLAPGVVVTWNGTAFDLPFLATRAERHGVPLELDLVAGRWGAHRHVDAYLAYRDVGGSLRISCGLKSIARLVGLAPVEVDRSDIVSLSPEELERYVASDAEVTRTLALRRRPLVAAH